MSSMEGVIEELHAHERIPGGIPFGEGVRLASEGIETIAQGAIESFHMHCPGWLHARSQRGTGLHRQEAPMRITMFDGLRQGDRLWNDPRGTSPFARQYALTIGSHEDAPIAMPTITEPGEGALMSSFDCGSHRLLKEILAQWASGAGDDEATLSILDHTSPALPLVRLGSSALFFWTNDQNSAISTWLRCKSLASTCVRAAAWVAARFSHTLIVSYLCPVISSAARKLPRRITINRACATSPAGVFSPYIGVPCVSPKYVVQFRQ
jgi:hypothetical protein